MLRNSEQVLEEVAEHHHAKGDTREEGAMRDVGGRVARAQGEVVLELLGDRVVHGNRERTSGDRDQELADQRVGLRILGHREQVELDEQHDHDSTNEQSRALHVLLLRVEYCGTEKSFLYSKPQTKAHMSSGHHEDRALEGVAYINLPHRTDRRQQIESQIEDVVPKGVCRVCIDAIRDLPGFLGCLRSHRKALETCLGRGWSCFAVFEDDFAWNAGVDGHILARAVRQAPRSCDALFLALNDKHRDFETVEADGGHRRILYTDTASGIVYFSRQLAQERVRLLQEAETKMTTLFRRHGVQTTSTCRYSLVVPWRNDQTMLQLYPRFQWHVKDAIGHQRESYSDIRGHNVRYGM